MDLNEGDATDVAIRAPKTTELVERLCAGKPPKKDNGTLRVTVLDSVSARPLPSLRVWLRWTGSYVGSLRPGGSITSQVGGFESLTDASGAATFCDVPADVRLVFAALRGDGKPAADSSDLRVGKNELRVSTVVTRRPNE